MLAEVLEGCLRPVHRAARLELVEESVFLHLMRDGKILYTWASTVVSTLSIQEAADKALEEEL